MLFQNDARGSQALAAATLPESLPDSAAVREQLDRILKSLMFRNSQRYTAFLTYCVERTLAGQGDALKERNIGVDVFGRPADYDTSSDHVVRSAASEIRKRLAQYYQEAGTERELRIGLQAGSYVTQFSAPRREAEAPSIAPEPRRPSAAPWRIGAMVTAVAMVGALAYFWFPFGKAPGALDEFWHPVLSSSQPVVLCLGGLVGAEPSGEERDSPTVGDMHRRRSNQVSYGSAATLARLTGLLESHGKQVRLMRRSATRFSDLRDGPAVLIGGYNNEWSMRLAGSLRFGFERIPGGRSVILDRTNPSNASWELDFTKPVREVAKDYALISRLNDPKTERPTIMVAGIGYWGTMAAGEFVTSPEQMDKLLVTAPKGWQQKNIQIVLSTEIVDDLPGPPKVVSTYFW